MTNDELLIELELKMSKHVPDPDLIKLKQMMKKLEGE